MRLSVVVGIAGITATIATLLAAVWLSWRHHFSMLFLSWKEIDAEARAVIARHDEYSVATVRKYELAAWQQRDYASQGRWHRIERAIIRIQRESCLTSANPSK